MGVKFGIALPSFLFMINAWVNCYFIFGCSRSLVWCSLFQKVESITNIVYNYICYSNLT